MAHVDPKNAKLAIDFISKNQAGSLATVNSDGSPQATVVYCFIDDDLNIYFSTLTNSRKYGNITENSSVSIVFYDEKNLTTLQLSGRAKRLEDDKLANQKLSKVFSLRYTDKNWPVPVIKMFESRMGDDIAIVKVTPSEMTFSNFETRADGQYKSFFTTII